MAAFVESPSVVLKLATAHEHSLRSKHWRVVEYSPYYVTSLVTNTVREEFVLFCNSHSNGIHRLPSVDQLLDNWLLRPVANNTFGTLSGGTIKYLLIALQSQASTLGCSVIAANIQQELDAEHVSRLVFNLDQLGVSRVVFSEDNVSLLERKLGRKVPRLSFAEAISDTSIAGEFDNA